MTASDDAGTSPKRSKVGRLIEEYEIQDGGERLERLWIDDGTDQKSLRELAEYFNQELVRAALETTDAITTEVEIENTYRLLNDEDVSEADRVPARRTLERNGLDVEKLEKDFVSHQAIHTYLTKYRQVSPPTAETENQVEKRARAIQKLQSRLETVATHTLEHLTKTGRLVLGQFDVIVTVRITCTDCGSQYDLNSLLSRGGCDCER